MDRNGDSEVLMKTKHTSISFNLQHSKLVTLFQGIFDGFHSACWCLIRHNRTVSVSGFQASELHSWNELEVWTAQWSTVWPVPSWSPNPPDSTRWCLASLKRTPSWGRYHNVCLILIQEIRKPVWKAQRWFSCSLSRCEVPRFWHLQCHICRFVQYKKCKHVYYNPDFEDAALVGPEQP